MRQAGGHARMIGFEVSLNGKRLYTAAAGDRWA